MKEKAMLRDRNIIENAGRPLTAITGILVVISVAALFVLPLLSAEKTEAAAQIQSVKVVNTSAEALPVAGSIDVANIVRTRPVVPQSGFSFTSAIMEEISQDPAGTNYAVTSLTATNFDPSNVAQVGLKIHECPDGAAQAIGPRVLVHPNETVHLTFPQAYVFRSHDSETGQVCLTVDGNGTYVSVVGYKF
jgi:hypothetical protein